MLSFIMIHYIWMLWFINLIFMCIVLLNLLIAVMSSAYEEALTDNFAVKYNFRCEMIVEALLIKEAITWIIGVDRSQIFCLSYSILKDEDEDDGQSGIKQIQTYIQTENKKIKEQICGMHNKMQE